MRDTFDEVFTVAEVNGQEVADCSQGWSVESRLDWAIRQHSIGILAHEFANLPHYLA